MTFDSRYNSFLRSCLQRLYSKPKFLGRYYFVKLVSKLFVMPKHPVIIEVLKGLKIEVNPYIDKGVESALFFTGTYEAGTLSFIENHLNEGDCFVDIGANIGLMSLTASKCVGDSGVVVSCEPNPSTIEILERNLSLNKSKNITIVKKAIGSTQSTAMIYPNWHINRGGASLIRKGNNEQGVEVEVTTLDNLIDELKLKPKMLKIDVEGFEFEVLKGATELILGNTPPIIIIEISSERQTAGGSVHSILDFIKRQVKYSFYINSGGKESKSRLQKIEDYSNLPLHDNVYCMPTVS
jgi:FkbM family methyltransferase